MTLSNLGSVVMCAKNSPHTTGRPPRRSIIELDRMVDQDEITEAELGQYFQEGEGISYNLEPVFTLDENFVEIPEDTLVLDYNYPIPNNEKWLEKTMESIGIADRNLQKNIMGLIVNDINPPYPTRRPSSAPPSNTSLSAELFQPTVGTMSFNQLWLGLVKSRRSF